MQMFDETDETDRFARSGRMLPMKDALPIGHEAVRVDAGGAAVADERRTIVNRRVEKLEPREKRDDEAACREISAGARDEFSDEELMEDDDSEVSLDDGELDSDDSNGVATGAVYQEAPPCNDRSLLGTRRLDSLLTRTCRAGRSDAHRRGPGSRDNGSRGGRGARTTQELAL